MVRLLLIAVVLGACSLPLAAPGPDLPANVIPPKIVHDIEIDEEAVCDFGYCGENRIAAAAGIDTARYEALTVAPIGHRAAEELADTIVRTFEGTKRPKVVFEDLGCGPREDACTSGEYAGDTIYLYDPTVGTLLHELAHHIQLTGPYLTYDDAIGDWRSHSDGFEWALRDVYLAYLAADIDHEALELPPLPVASSYAVGDCIEVEWFEIVPCEGAYGEVVEVVALEDGRWPGDDVIANRADRVCQLAVLEVAEDAAFDWLVPTESGWASGERDIVCLLLR